MDLIELLNKAEQLQLKLKDTELSESEIENVSKELEALMDKVYEIVDNDNNWIEVTTEENESEETNNENNEYYEYRLARKQIIKAGRIGPRKRCASGAAFAAHKGWRKNGPMEDPAYINTNMKTIIIFKEQYSEIVLRTNKCARCENSEEKQEQ